MDFIRGHTASERVSEWISEASGTEVVEEGGGRVEEFERVGI